MADTLINVLTFNALAPGAAATQPHGITSRSVAVKPDLAISDQPAVTITTTATDVTVRNDASETRTIRVFVLSFHSIVRALPDPLAPLNPQPFVALGGAADGQGSPFIGASYNDALSLDVYVDANNGNDSNTGLSKTSPLRTLRAVQRKFPLFLFGEAKIRVHLAGTGGADPFDQPATPATYTEGSFFLGSAAPKIANFVYRGPQMVPFVPTTGPSSVGVAATPTQRILQNGTVDAAGRRTRFNAAGAPGWTVNDFRGTNAFLRIKRGSSLVLFELPITQNGADFVVCDVAVDPGVVVAGDILEIVRPGAVIVGQNDLQSISIRGHGASIAADGFANPAGQGQTFERIQFGTTLSPVFILGAGVGFDRCCFAFGVQQDGGVVDYLNCKCLDGLGAGVFSGGRMGGNFMFPRPDSADSPLAANQGVDIFLNSIVVVGGGVFAGLQYQGCGTVFAWFTLSSYDSPETGIFVWNTGSMLSQQSSSTAAIMGDGNTTVGIHCVDGGQAIVRGGKNTQITGAAGDLKVGTGAAVSYGTGAGQFEEAAGFNGNLHRVGGSTPTVPLGDLSRIGVAL